MKNLLLKNGNVVCAADDAVCQCDILIEDGKIARLGHRISSADAEVIDCSGKMVTAGFVDAHVHIESSMVLPDAFGRAVLPHGTTDIVADPHEVVNVAGADGLRFFLREAAKSPIDIHTVVPSSVPATPLDTNGAGKFTAEQMTEFADCPDVVGLGEVMCYHDVAAGNPEILSKISLFRHKTIDGHTAGMPAGMLAAYTAAGVQNDHECSDIPSMMQRYDCGMNIYVREGSAARNATPLLAYAHEKQLDTSRFAFCTDDKHLATIAAEGHISHIVRLALKTGFSWPQTARMASLNPCRFYKIGNKGDIRQGYAADIVVTDGDCRHIDMVIKNGRIAARNQSLLLPEGAPTAVFENSVKFRHLTSADFALPERLRGVAIGLVDGQLLTERLTLSGDDGKSQNLLATVERYGKNGNIAVCALSGYGIRGGAIATSVSHDSHNVVCAGDNPVDMAAACNRLKEIGGGYVIASGGSLVDEMPLPAFGLMSDKNAEQAAEKLQTMDDIARRMGVNPNIDAFITLSFAALPVIPTLRLLDTGLYDTEQGKFL